MELPEEDIFRQLIKIHKERSLDKRNMIRFGDLNANKTTSLKVSKAVKDTDGYITRHDGPKDRTV